MQTAMFHRLSSLAVLSLVLSLGACLTMPEPPPKAVVQAPPAKPVKKTVKKTATPAKPKPAPAEQPVAEPAEPPAPPIPPVVADVPDWPPVLPALPDAAVQPEETAAALPAQPLDVVGKSEAEVIALLGRPATEQVASAVKVLHFQAEGCAVEVHLFPDVRHGGYRALEMTGAGDTAPPYCLGRLRATRG